VACALQPWQAGISFDQSSYEPPTFGDAPPSADGVAPEDYAWWLHFRVLPWYGAANAPGGLCSQQGTATLANPIWPYVTNYVGYVDANGKACGIGTQTSTPANYVMTGGHYNDQAHGLFKWEVHDNSETDFTFEIVEFKDNETFGRRTDYHGVSGEETVVDNLINEANVSTYIRNDIANPETEAWYSLDSEIITALNPNWEDYTDPV